jgi:hypothetical protein
MSWNSSFSTHNICHCSQYLSFLFWTLLRRFSLLTFVCVFFDLEYFSFVSFRLLTYLWCYNIYTLLHFLLGWNRNLRGKTDFKMFLWRLFINSIGDWRWRWFRISRSIWCWSWRLWFCFCARNHWTVCLYILLTACCSVSSDHWPHGLTTCFLSHFHGITQGPKIKRLIFFLSFLIVLFYLAVSRGFYLWIY